MSHHSELPKVIDKSQADIDAAIQAIQATSLSGHIKDFCISCIRLAVWLPSALLEHKITSAILRKLIFGSETRKAKNKNSSDA